MNLFRQKIETSLCFYDFHLQDLTTMITNNEKQEVKHRISTTTEIIRIKYGQIYIFVCLYIQMEGGNLFCSFVTNL